MRAVEVESVVDFLNVCNSLFVSSSLLEIASHYMFGTAISTAHGDITVVKMSAS